jgi:hypothetical protein
MLTEQDVTTRNEIKGKKKETLLTNKHKHDDVDGKNDCEIKQRETAWEGYDILLHLVCEASDYDRACRPCLQARAYNAWNVPWQVHRERYRLFNTWSVLFVKRLSFNCRRHCGCTISTRHEQITSVVVGGSLRAECRWIQEKRRAFAYITQRSK